jgi:hypothetical protein
VLRWGAYGCRAADLLAPRGRRPAAAPLAGMLLVLEVFEYPFYFRSMNSIALDHLLGAEPTERAPGPAQNWQPTVGEAATAARVHTTTRSLDPSEQTPKMRNPAGLLRPLGPTGSHLIGYTHSAGTPQAQSS